MARHSRLSPDEKVVVKKYNSNGTKTIKVKIVTNEKSKTTTLKNIVNDTKKTQINKIKNVKINKTRKTPVNKKDSNFKNQEKVLEVENLSVQFPVGEGIYFNALNGISFDIKKGEVVGLVGESGSGKSTTANAILGLAPHSTGFIKINNELVPNRPRDVKGRVKKWLASKVQMIFQDAKSSLNPREKIFNVIVEGARNQKLYEKQKKLILVNFANDYLKNNLDKKGTKEYKILKLEADWVSDKQKLKDDYEEKYSKIFTKYDDQRVITNSCKLKRKTDIRRYKSSYKLFIGSLKESSDKDSIKNIKVKAQEKLMKDIAFIDENYKKDIAKEKQALHKIHLDFIQKKKIFKKEYHLSLKKIDEIAKAKIKTLRETPSTQEDIGFIKGYKVHKNKTLISKRDFYRNIVNEVMEKVSISPEHINRYPGEFSGGQAQRIAIARTLAMHSDIIIADEPISALDVSIQAQVINLLKNLIKKEKMTVLFIAHDLQVVRYISNRIIVMYKGELIEEGSSDEVYYNPIHPYTKTLINAIPSIDNPERIRDSKPYIPKQIENFMNLGQIKKQWHKVAPNHKVFGTIEEFKEWTNNK